LRHGDGGVVVDFLGVDGLDEGEAVGNGGGVGEQFADPRARLTAL
jgi:hypothetical protein